MAEKREKSREIIGVFAESVIVRNGFGFSVDDEFVGIAAASLAVERRAPLAEDVFEFFCGDFGELRDGFDAERAKGTFGDFTDARNFSDGKRREEFCFLARRDPDESARLGLIAGN